ncbi:hypothetical protein QEN19_003784 [Hanseniaspora menglaensis]
MSRNNTSNSSAQQTDGFWSKNGPAIMSTTGSVVSTTFKAGKYVAQTGYSAGKSHYNNQQKKKNEQEAKSDNSGSTSFTPVESLKSADAFAPPPLRPGQMQYQKSGVLLNAGETSIARQHQIEEQTSHQVLQTSSSDSIIPSQNLQPLYNSAGTIIGYIPIQQNAIPLEKVNQTPVASTSRAPVPIPNSSSSLSISSTQGRAPLPIPSTDSFTTIETRAPAIIPVHNVSQSPLLPSFPQRNNAVLTPDTTNSTASDSPQYEVTPYQFIDPEEREKMKKLTIESKIDVLKVPPPPMHVGRGKNLDKSLSQVVDEKIRSQSSSREPKSSSSHNSSTSVHNLSNSSQKNSPGIPKIDLEEDLSHIEKKNDIAIGSLESSNKIENDQIAKETPGILGTYDYSKKVDFKPPPRASVPEGFVAPSTRQANMRMELESKRHGANTSSNQNIPTPPLSRGSSVSSISSSIPKPTVRKARSPPALQVAQRTSSTNISSKYSVNHSNKPPESTEKVEKALVLGTYDYNKQVSFQPPPMAKRSERDLEFIHQKQERSRITTNSSLRQQTPQQPPRRFLKVLDPNEIQNQSNSQTMPNGDPSLKLQAVPTVLPKDSLYESPPAYISDYGQSKPINFAPPPKPVKPTSLNTSPELLKSNTPAAINIPPPKPKKPDLLSTNLSSTTLSSKPVIPAKPGLLKAPSKPKKPVSLQVDKSDSDENPFAKYNPNSAV